MYANPQMEQINREDLSALQLSRLRKTVEWAKAKSRFYQMKLENISSQDIQTLDDVQKLPFTTVADLLKHSPLDFLTMPFSGILRINYAHPMKIAKAYANGDIARNVEMMARVFVAAGVHKASVVGVLGDFSESRIMDIQYALEVLGATVVPLGVDFQRAIAVMELSGMDTMVGDSQHLMQLIVQTQVRDKDIAEHPWERVFCLVDAVQNPMRRHFEERLKATVYDLFSSVEIGFAGLLYPCQAHFGAHLQEDHYYAEVIEFGGTRAIPDASKMGELVVTSLSGEAMPLIRYRTGQAIMRVAEPCTCGRTFTRFVTPFWQM